MKATLIYRAVLWGASPLPCIGHEIFEYESTSTISDYLSETVKKLTVDKKCEIIPLYVHLDGILFELTEKPAVLVLADVMTGIEI